MIRAFEYDEELWRRGAERSRTMPIYERSHRGRHANLVGALGEVMFEHWLSLKGCWFVFDSLTTHDYRVGPKQVTVEVKTKDRTVPPRPSFDATIPLYNADHQHPDWYVFISLLRASNIDDPVRRYTTAYLVGCYPADRFRSGKIWRAGDVDPANGTKFWTDCINRPISQLLDLETIAMREWA